MNTKNRLFILALMCFASVFLASCEKDEDTADVSFVTTYPTIELTGEQWDAIMVGESYTDPGVEAFEGETPIEYTTTGSVDPNTPGAYVITYTATNSDGFSTSVRRYVGVITPEAAAIDLSGQYQRNAGALGVSTVIRLEPGLYQTNNIGGIGAPGPATTVNFFHPTVNNLVVPPQNVLGNEFAAVDATVIPGTSYSWSVVNPGYGTVLRTFVKL